MLGSKDTLEQGMVRLLQGIGHNEARGMHLRRASATCLRALVLAWRYLCCWGRWRSTQQAHHKATSPDKFNILLTTRLPSSEDSIRWRRTKLSDLWPTSLVKLFERDLGLERPKDASKKGQQPIQGPRGLCAPKHKYHPYRLKHQWLP